jgi:hypothetical protein
MTSLGYMIDACGHIYHVTVRDGVRTITLQPRTAKVLEAAQQWAKTQNECSKSEKEKETEKPLLVNKDTPKDPPKSFSQHPGDKLTSRKVWTNEIISVFIAKMRTHLFKYPSTIAGAGFGLVTDVAIPQGFLFVEYTGFKLSSLELKRQYGRFTAPYAIAVQDAKGAVMYYLDAIHPKHSIARYANDARDPAKNNAEFEQYKNQIYLRATRPIAAGEEIFVSYTNHEKTSKEHYWANPREEMEQQLFVKMVEEHTLGRMEIQIHQADETARIWSKEELRALICACETKMFDEALQLALNHEIVRQNQTMYSLNTKHPVMHTFRRICQLNNPQFGALTKKRLACFSSKAAFLA